MAMFKTFGLSVGATYTKIVDAEPEADRMVRIWGDVSPANHHIAITPSGVTPAAGDFYRQEPELIEDFVLPEDYELWAFDPSGSNYLFGLVTRALR